MVAAASQFYPHFLCLNALFLYLLHQNGATASMHPAFATSRSCHGSTATASSHISLNLSRRHRSPHKSVVLSASSNDGNAGNTSRSARERGIYARPSAAIEKGSGFFIPGLEGSRIRFLFGITVLVADAANHVLLGGAPGDWGQVIAETLSAFYGALLLLQGSIEMGVEKGFAQGGESESMMIGDKDEDAPLNSGGGSSSNVADALRENGAALEATQRIARTIITFTPATDFLFAVEGLGVLYSFGIGNALAIDTDEQKRLVKVALDAVSGSRGGRVALPSDHPASKLLPEAATRCILVQKMEGYQGSPSCMIIGSDKLLQSFTKNDLRWIGQLAEYNKLLGDKS